MPNRKMVIENALATCERILISNPERFESWHHQFLTSTRRDFDDSGDLRESAFITLEKLRAKVDPPSGKPGIKSSEC